MIYPMKEQNETIWLYSSKKIYQISYLNFIVSTSWTEHILPFRLSWSRQHVWRFPFCPSGCNKYNDFFFWSLTCSCSLWSYILKLLFVLCKWLLLAQTFKLLINPAFLLYFRAKDDIDIDALAAEIEGAGAAKEQEPQKSKGKKKKEKKKQDFE